MSEQNAKQTESKPVPERLMELWEKGDTLAHVALFSSYPVLKRELEEMLHQLAEVAQEVDMRYVRLDTEGDVPTVAQGVALARFIRNEFHKDDGEPKLAYVSKGGAGLPDTYLHVSFPGSSYEGGIDKEGRVST